MIDAQTVLCLQDAEKNRLKQWKESQLNTGVFSAELPLSESPVLGDWTITAEVGEEVKFSSVQPLHYMQISNTV